MSSFAVGKKALGICDRCGFRYKLLELKKEWNGSKVCRYCFEPKAPQLEPLPHATDAEALHEPRVDRQDEGGVFAIGIKNSGEDHASTFSLFDKISDTPKVSVGKVTVTIS